VAHAWAPSAFRPYTHHDVLGVELGGVVKNVVGLAVGMAEGLGYGDNAKASIITRGLAQTSRLAVALGAEPATLAGLAGMGDLVATCASPLSRNHQTGVQLGRGLDVEAAAAVVRQTAEGVRSAPEVLALAHGVGVEMPIVEQVVAVVRGEVSAREAGRALLAQAADTMRLTARGYTRILRVARTIADLGGAEQVGRVHVAEALSYRRRPPVS